MKDFLIRLIDIVLGPFYGKLQFQSFFGLLYSISLKGFNLRHRSMKTNGEQGVIKKIHHYCQISNIEPIVFDVGANEGQYSQELIRQFGMSMSLHCFEPSVKTFQRLSFQLVEHGTIHLHKVGLGERNEKFKFFVSSYDSTLNSMYARGDAAAVSYDGKEEVEIRRLSDFCMQESITHIHFLKIDVEGNELSVLKGGEDLIRQQKVDFIQFEFGSRNVDARTYLADFFNMFGEEYELFRIMRNGLYSMPIYNYDYEIFAIGNYLAISKKVVKQFLKV
jgi:FkbM family methyltransferase